LQERSGRVPGEVRARGRRNHQHGGEREMMKWIVAGMTIVTLSLGGAALATKEMGKDVGVTGCAKCHEG
jgi:hypothetical protein